MCFTLNVYVSYIQSNFVHPMNLLSEKSHSIVRLILLSFIFDYLRLPVENAPWMSWARQSLTVLWSPILWLPVWVCILYLIRQMIYRQTEMYSLAFLYNDLSVRLCARGRVDSIQHCIALIHYIHECGALLQ